jgi:hypothetical protein
MPTGGGGGDAAPADSGADASVRPAGRPARTRLAPSRTVIAYYALNGKCAVRRTPL